MNRLSFLTIPRPWPRMMPGQIWREKEVPEAKWLPLEQIKILSYDGHWFYFATYDTKTRDYWGEYSCSENNIIPKYDLIDEG